LATLASLRPSIRLIALLLIADLMASSPAIGQTPDGPAAPPPPRFEEPQYTLGPASAAVTVVEYFSDTCPHCAAFDALVFPYVRSNYIGPGRVRYIFREALTPPPAISAAGFILARCAGETKYLDVVEAIFRNQPSVVKRESSRGALLDIGRQAGLTDQDMQDCLSDDEALKAFRGRVDAALAAGVTGTPTFVFNGHVLQPGERIAGSVYQGGELTKAQFDAAYIAATRNKAASQTGSPP
jgi:protein-disulfide isomerase